MGGGFGGIAASMVFNLVRMVDIDFWSSWMSLEAGDGSVGKRSMDFTLLRLIKLIFSVSL